jgi:probable HAF family extracellular repeat protein
MKSRFSIYIAAVTVCAALAIPVGLAAQNRSRAKSNTPYHHYQFHDLGTFGGPASYFSFGGPKFLNNRGTAAGSADTSTPDPFPAFCFDPDCYVAHGSKWHDGQLIDLGPLATNWSSQANWISENGLITGQAQNGEIDPLLGIPESRAVIWQGGGITDLGTLEGGYESIAASVNDSAQVAGLALNTVSDPFCLLFPGFCNTQTRAVLWQSGIPQDLGTLGGPDAIAFFVNEHGQVAGFSYTNSTPNSATDACGTNVPTADPFLWDKHKGMTDLGTLGGTCGIPSAVNDGGQVVGLSDLAGDATFHPFLWDKHSNPKLRDLGTFGGDNGQANWINNRGEVVGKADLSGSETHDAFLWNNSVMTDLGTQDGDPCSNALFINSRGQIVGGSTDCSTFLHAFLWERGGPMVDLNSLIPSGSSLELILANDINDHGEIVGVGVPAGCSPQDADFCGHAYALTPCDENHPGLDGCDYSTVDASALPFAAAASARPAPREAPRHMPLASLWRRNNRFHFPLTGPQN